jgi:hypothetical protein
MSATASSAPTPSWSRTGAKPKARRWCNIRNPLRPPQRQTEIDRACGFRNSRSLSRPEDFRRTGEE